MLGVGDTIPDARVWTAPRQSTSLRALAGERRMLLVFYLFDWSST